MACAARLHATTDGNKCCHTCSSMLIQVRTRHFCGDPILALRCARAQSCWVGDISAHTPTDSAEAVGTQWRQIQRLHFGPCIGVSSRRFPRPLCAQSVRQARGL
jgi:hypothetical protein